MALQIKNCMTKFGFVAPVATCVIDSISITRTTLNFSVRKYAVVDAQCFAEDYYTARYDPDGDDPFTQAYAFIMALPDFADAQWMNDKTGDGDTA